MWKSIYCNGERCQCCKASATEKVEQVMFADNTIKHMHPLTAYLCRGCFGIIMGEGAVQRQEEFRDFATKNTEK